MAKNLPVVIYKLYSKLEEYLQASFLQILQCEGVDTPVGIYAQRKILNTASVALQIATQLQNNWTSYWAKEDIILNSIEVDTAETDDIHIVWNVSVTLPDTSCLYKLYGEKGLYSFRFSFTSSGTS